ncbi:LAMI_0H13190g1_1 [Lachancea mirantina]|uniref:LAMI_0H13190g1_1 n=1 Tax=Lachancea mirantina TaxID=1230905 RepID=A0A1G4KHX0_9SACH|nr:LAMI_0H13190g1_1 [Lachancea mirantina]
MATVGHSEVSDALHHDDAAELMSNSVVKKEDDDFSVAESSIVNGDYEKDATKDDGTFGQVLPEQPTMKIIERKISGYVGFANLPKQWHRKSIRRGFSLNLLCVGKKGLGKTTLINTLFNQELQDPASAKVDDQLANLKLEDPEKAGEAQETPVKPKVQINTISTTIEENGVQLALNVIDAAGFGDAIDNTDAWEPIVREIDSRFDQYLDAENRIDRTSIQDNRIHACVYFIEPSGHCLSDLDLTFCKSVHEKCNLIPVIAKSDILTDEEIEQFKIVIRSQLQEAGVNLFEPPHYSIDDDETVKSSKSLSSKIPFAVVGSTKEVATPDGRQVRGRQYPWGIIEVDNAAHSDFVYLRDLLIRHYLEELRERTSNVLYEHYRSEKLSSLGIKQDNAVFKEFDPTMRQKEEKQLHEAKLAKLESEMKAVFQQKVSEKEKKLQKSEAELFARHKEMKDKLTKQLKALEDKKRQIEMSMANQANNSPIQPKKKGFLR